METVAELEARVIAGDDTVKPSQLANAQAAERLAALQRLSDERKEREAEEDAHQAAVAEFMADYEEFMTTDIEPIRSEYANLVVSVAALRAVLEEHLKKQYDIASRARRLGLNKRPDGRVVTNATPVAADRERWQAQYMHRLEDYIAYAVQEGQQGFPQHNGSVALHPLLTDERREELRSLTSSDKQVRGVEMRDRILNEALSSE